MDNSVVVSNITASCPAYSGETWTIVPVSLGVSGARKYVLSFDGSEDSVFVKSMNHGVKIKDLLDALIDRGYSCPKCLAEFTCGQDTVRAYQCLKGYDASQMDIQSALDSAFDVAANLHIMDSLAVKPETMAAVPVISIQDKLEECISEICSFHGEHGAVFQYSRDYFIQKAKEYAQSFNGLSPSLLHGDIKLDNIMFSGGKTYLIDDGDMSFGPFAFNFQYTAQQIFAGDNIKGSFIVEVIRRYFNGCIPDAFHQNIKFILIKKFFNRFKNKQAGAQRDFVRSFQEIFQQIFSEEKLRALL